MPAPNQATAPETGTRAERGAPAAPGRMNAAYIVFILVISVAALAILAVTTLVRLDPETQTLLLYADHAICVLFFLDFLNTLARAPHKRRYFFTWGWLDLLSSIPMIEALRIARVARLVRIFRVLRGIRSLRILSRIILERRAQSTMLATILLTILLILFGSVAILQFERGPDSRIHGAQDALWWSIATMVTGGEAEHAPVTLEGRAIASVLMVGVILLLATLSGFVAAWFLSPGEKQQEDEISLLRREIQELREALPRNRPGSRD